MKIIRKEELDTILEWFTESTLTSATVEYGGDGSFRVEMSRSSSGGAPSDGVGYGGAQEQDNRVAPVPTRTQEDTAADEKKTVNAPIVGTFYRAANPDTPPFVQVGDEVKKGQVLCIIEAMKVMNELEAEFDMKILSVLVENAHLVEYDQPLFEVVPL